VISPYETVQFLLRVTSDHELFDGNFTPALYSALYDITVTMESERGDHQSIMTTTEVIFNPVYGIDMWVDEPRKITRPYEPVEYIITIKNTGNVEEVVLLSLGGDAYGLEGVDAFLYALSDWDWLDDDQDGSEEWYMDPIYILPVITIDDEGTKDFFPDAYHYDRDDHPGTGSNTDPDYPIPGPIPGDLSVIIEAGDEIKVILWVMVMYEEGTFELSVEGVVPDHPETGSEVTTETVMKEVEYLGFEMYASVTEQTALSEEVVDYYIHLSNPGYYSDEISLELGGRSYMAEGVTANLYLMNNVYYFDPYLDQFMRQENGDYYVEYDNTIYDPGYSGEQEFNDKNPGYDWNNFPGNGNPQYGGPGAASGGNYQNGQWEYDNYQGDEYFVDDVGSIFKNYEYEYEFWEGTEHGPTDEDRLVPLIGEDMSVHLGPFQSVWLLLRVTTYYDEGDTLIDVTAESVHHPEFKETISTVTHIVSEGDFGLELYIGDPVHYTAYGVTTVYVFQLTNTGNLKDTVLLELAGEDAFDPHVYVEIGVRNVHDDEPVFLTDKYDNVIIPYDGITPASRDRNSYYEWVQDLDTDPSTGQGTDQGEPAQYEHIVITPDGDLVMPGASVPLPQEEGNDWEDKWGDDWEDRWSDPTTFQEMTMEPVEYHFENWDNSGGIPEGFIGDFSYRSSMNEGPNTGNNVEPLPTPGSMDVGWWGSCDKADTGFYDLDCGFIPFPVYGEKYVDVEAGETVIVTMKVTVYNWDNIWFDDTTGDPYYGIDGNWDPDEKDMIGGDGSDEKNTDNTWNDENNGGNREKEGEIGEIERNGDQEPETDYEITLIARSSRVEGVKAEAKTTTYIYDSATSNGIWNKRISGVFNVNDRIITQEILENGFVIMPLILESGKIEFNVSGEFNESRIVVVNLDATNLDELGNYEIFFDEMKIGKMGPDKLVEYDGTEAKYAIVESENGIQLLVYIPHFSEHTISLRSVPSNGGDDSGFSGSWIVMALGMGLVLGMVGLNQRQRIDDRKKKEFRLKINEEPKKAEDYAKPLNSEAKALNGSGASKEIDDVDSLLNESLFKD